MRLVRPGREAHGFDAAAALWPPDVDSKDGDLDVVPDHDGFANPPGQNEQGFLDQR